MTHSFSYIQRLHQPAEFQSVLDAKGLVNKWLVIHSQINHRNLDRLGIIVSKRVVAKAVSRNRLKRLIREVFRQSLTVEANPGLDIVVRVKRKLSKEETPEFIQALKNLLLKVRMIKNDASVAINY
ncbi:MAG: ribonuclease P protein component [Gallionellaceae bacterium]